MYIFLDKSFIILQTSLSKPYGDFLSRKYKEELFSKKFIGRKEGK